MLWGKSFLFLIIDTGSNQRLRNTIFATHTCLVFFTTRQVFCSDLHYTLAHCVEVIVTLWSLKTKLSFWWVVVLKFFHTKKLTNKYFWLSTKNGLILQNIFHNFSTFLNWTLAIDLSLNSNLNQIILVLRMAKVNKLVLQYYKHFQEDFQTRMI